MRDLAELQGNWEHFGQDDPLWAVLTDPTKRGGRWDPAEFLALGEAEIAALMRDLAAFDLPRERMCALDFGCGVGRLSAALASRFAQVIGVDISAAMLANARRLVPHDNIAWMHETSGALPQVATGSVDLVYSNMTLQHVPPPHNLAYVREFLRVLKPGGVAVFHVPAGLDWSLRGVVHRTLPRAALNGLRRIIFRSRAVMEMHVIPEASIRGVAAANGATVREVAVSTTAGDAFIGRRYVITKDQNLKPIRA